jgi:Flp pilus assembly protein TadD
MSRSRDVDAGKSRPPRSPAVTTDPVVLRRNIERALDRDDSAAEVLPMLERLQRVALEGSDDATYADRRMAELLLETAPWRAALHIRRLVESQPHEDATWALMGLAQALLGHYRYACASYRKALAISPGNPWYSHNLGHLLDVALDRPHDARKHLERAHSRVPDEPAITCSLVHALWRAGQVDEARRVLRPLLITINGTDPDVTALAAELDRDAPGARKRTPLGGPRAKRRRRTSASPR